jgi:dTDP-4-dehydrorhamnose reductase
VRILLVGGSGQLGRDLLRANPGHEVHAPRRDELDLADAAQTLERVRALRPQMVINCAAFHDVALCEAQPEAAFAINCIAVRDLALACVEAGAWLVTFSTDYVFGGDKRAPYLEHDPTGPVQTYGITRLAGEHAALAAAPERAVVIRTCGLYGAGGSRSRGGNFVDARAADARAGKRIEMGSEQRVSPTATADLSRAVYQLIAHPQLAAGVYHLVNEGECSWYELTRAVYELLGSGAEVVPVDRGGRWGAYRQPLYSVLANTRARKLGVTLRPWREALAAYLERGAA